MLLLFLIKYFSYYLAPKTKIIEGSEVYVKSGSTTNLTCIIEDNLITANYVFWYYEGTVINFDSPRKGIKIVTNRGPKTISKLLIYNSKVSDSGSYACKPMHSDFANVTLHVLKHTSNIVSTETTFQMSASISLNDHTKYSVIQIGFNHLCIICLYSLCNKLLYFYS